MKTSSLSAQIKPIPVEEGVRLMAADLERAHRFNKAHLLFGVYRAESTRARAEALLEAGLQAQGFHIERVRLPLPDEPDWPYYVHFHPPDGDTVFFVYDLRRAFPEMLQYLNYRREIFVEQRVRAVFWVLEEEAREVALKAPDFWAFRGQVLEFLELPPPRERVEAARELSWWGFHEVREGYESPQEIKDRIALRERLLEELGEEDETVAARAELHYTLGGLYWAKREYDRALEHTLRALALAHRTANERLETWAWNGLGNVYTDLGRYEEAIAAYQKAIELDPKFTWPWNNLGTVYDDLGRYEEAIAAYQKAIELDPQFTWPWNNLGTVYDDLGRYEEAIAAYQKAIELDPQFAAPWNGLGNVYYQQGRREEAIQAYQQAIELDPRNAVPYSSVARVYRRLGEQDKVAEYSAKARELMSPDDWYNRACLESICGNTEAALENLRQALEERPAQRDWAKHDPDLEWIRDDPRFWEIVGDYQQISG